MYQRIAPVVDSARIVRRILRNRRTHLDRRRLARSYMGLILQQARQNGQKRKQPGVAPVMGFHVHHLSIDTVLFLFEEVFLNEDYFFEAARRQPLIVDCGSNIGMTTLYLKTLYPESRIIGFEPFGPAYSCLRSNIDTNRLSDVTVHNAALGAEAGSAEFFFNEEEQYKLNMSLMSGRAGKQTSVSVPMCKLSEYIQEPVDLLKLDIEGGERAVIEELRRADRLRLVREMIIEYHHHVEGSDDRLADFLSILEASGYGYQIRGRFEFPYTKYTFQDLQIYAYHKDSAPH